MTPENIQDKPIILPAIGILSETKDRPEYYDRVRVLGLRTDFEGNKYFILGIEQKDNKIVIMRDRKIPESHDDLQRYQKSLEEIKRKI